MTAAPNSIRIEQAYPGIRIDVAATWDARTLAIFGPSGSGKTTIIETIAGIRRIRGCGIVIAGRVLDDAARGFHLPIASRRLGWVPQDASLFPHLSVVENIDFGVRSGSRRIKRAQAIDMLEIGHLLHRLPRDLSGGERQRVALARALAAEPETLLLDEPLASLDLPLRSRIFPYLIRLRDESGLPMIYVTHDAGEAIGIAQHVMILEEGRVVAAGSPETLLRTPAALRLLDLVELENRIEITDVTERPDLGRSDLRTTGGLQIAAAGALFSPGEVVGIRAEDILLARERPSGLSAQNVIQGTIADTTEESGRVLVSIRAAGEIVRAAVTHHARDELDLAPGREVWIIFKAYAVHRLAGRPTAPGSPLSGSPPDAPRP